MDGGVFTDGFGDSAFDFPSGFVGVVNDAVSGVAAFSTEIEGVAGGEIESGALAGEPLDSGGSLLDEHPNGIGVAESGSGGEGVFFVEFPGIGFSDGGGDSSLRPGCV